MDKDLTFTLTVVENTQGLIELLVNGNSFSFELTKEQWVSFLMDSVEWTDQKILAWAKDPALTNPILKKSIINKRKILEKTSISDSTTKSKPLTSNETSYFDPRQIWNLDRAKND